DLPHRKLRQPLRLVTGQGTATPANPDLVPLALVTVQVLVDIECPNAKRVVRPGLQQRQVPVRMRDDDAGMVDTVRAGDLVAQACDETLIGGEEDVAGLREIGLRRAAWRSVLTERRLVEKTAGTIDLEKLRAGQGKRDCSEQCQHGRATLLGHAP